MCFKVISDQNKLINIANKIEIKSEKKIIVYKNIENKSGKPEKDFITYQNRIPVISIGLPRKLLNFLKNYKKKIRWVKTTYQNLDEMTYP